MRKLLFIGLILFFRLCPCLCQSVQEQSPEQLKSLLPKAGKDTARVRLLLRISDAYITTGNPGGPASDSAMRYAQQAQSLAEALKNEGMLGSAYILESKVLADRNSLPEGRAAAQKGIDIFLKNKDEGNLAEGYMALAKNYNTYDTGIVQMIRAYHTAADLFHRQGNKVREGAAMKREGEMMMYQGKMEDAMARLKQSLAAYQSVGYKEVQEVYSLIGVCYTETGNYSEGLNYGLQAVRTAEQLKDNTKGTGLIYNYIAVTYDHLGQFEESAAYLKKALPIAKATYDTPFVVMLVTNISHTLLRLNKPEEAISYLNDFIRKYPEPTDPFARLQITTGFLKGYMIMKDYKSAGPYCAKVLKECAGFKEDDPALLAVYPHIIDYYQATKQFDKSLKYLELQKGMAEKGKMVNTLKSVHYLWYKQDSAQGNLSSALEHYKLFKKYNDSLFNETKSRQIAQLQIQFKTEQKDKDILMLTKQSEFQKKELKQAALLRNLTLGGIALLIIIVGLLYNQYRIKQRNNNRLEKKQAEINEKNISLQHLLDEKQWLLKEIHHRVKNNLQMVMSLLNSQSAYLQDDAALAAVQDSQHRVQAMSLIHQKLYNTDNVSTIDMPVYIHELIEYMRDCFTTGQRIRFEVAVDPLDLDVCQAIPIGLILNEAITNSIKYAFPDGRDGIIKVSLTCAADKKCVLAVSDNGTGIPLNFMDAKPRSLGMSLIQGLSEDLEGELKIENNNGTVLTVSFVQDLGIKRVYAQANN